MQMQKDNLAKFAHFKVLVVT